MKRTLFALGLCGALAVVPVAQAGHHHGDEAVAAGVLGFVLGTALAPSTSYHYYEYDREPVRVYRYYDYEPSRIYIYRDGHRPWHHHHYDRHDHHRDHWR